MAKVSWNQASGDVSGYVVQITKSDGTASTVRVGPTSLSTNVLVDAGDTITVEVKAVGPGGDGPLSTPVSYTEPALPAAPGPVDPVVVTQN